MILKNIFLYLKSDDFPLGFASEFDFKGRYLCNFIERNIRAVKFKTDAYNKLCIQGVVGEMGCGVVPENALLVRIPFDMASYVSLSEFDRHEFYINFMRLGISGVPEMYPLPISQIYAAVDAFREGGYKNEWDFASRLSREKKIKAVLQCSMGPEKFELFLLLIDRGGAILSRSLVLEALPDEIIFSHKFKDIIFEGDEVLVTDRFGKVIFRKNI